MQSKEIRDVGVLLVMTVLGSWSPQLCVAQGNIYTGKVISKDANTITLNLNPCGTERKQTVSPYKTVGAPTDDTCPNGKVYTKVTVVESEAGVIAAREFSGKVVSESKDTITLDLTPCGAKTLKVISPYEKKGSAVDASCPNGDKYSKITVAERSPNDKERD